jgi:hypothetical protein
MGSFLRRPAVFGVCVVALSLAAGLAEPAQADRGNGNGKHAQEPADAGYEQPPGLVGNDHAQAKGHEKKAPEEPLQPEPAEPAVEPEGPADQPKSSLKGVESAASDKQHASSGNRSGDAHHHLVVCHRTGSASNPYVVINIPWTAWSEAHSPSSAHAHSALDGRVDLVLNDPASRPGSKDGFTSADCRVDDPVPPPPPAPTPLDPPTPPVPPPSSGAFGGGALGQDPGSAGQGALPFTGLPVLLALLVALGAAVSAAGIAGGAGQKSQRFQRRPRQSTNGSDVRHVTAHEALDGAPDDPGSG